MIAKSTTQKQEKSPAKKTYHSPELTVRNSISQLTQTNKSGSSADNPGQQTQRFS